MMVNCVLNNFETKARIATASQLSLVKKDFLKKVGLASRINQELKEKLTTGISDFQTIGCIENVQLRLGDKNYILNLSVVESLMGDVWIGTDFLKSHQCSLSAEQFVIDGENVIPVLMDDDDDNCITIGLVQKVNMSP